MRSPSQRGSILAVVLILVVLMAGLTLAFHQLTFQYHRASATSRDREAAYQVASTGATYFLAELKSDSTYLDSLSKPWPEVTTEDGSFALELVTAPTTTRWELQVVGRAGSEEYRLGVAMGFSQFPIPGGITIGGTGNPTNKVLTMTGSGFIGSYDPDDGPYDPASPGTDGKVSLSGSVQTTGGSTIYGDVDATGTISDPYAISGTASAGATVDAIEDIDPTIQAIMDDSKLANDNATLSTIFGSDFSPVAGTENYGDLIVSGGTYTIPAGTYRFRQFEVTGGAKIVFDNSTGPTNLVYLGAGRGKNDLTVSASTLVVDSPSPEYSLRTILATDADFAADLGSLYGQNISDPDSAGYSILVSLGGNASSDDIVLGQNTEMYARVYAAAHDLKIGSNSQWFGSGVMRTLSITGGVGGPAGFYIDEDSYSAGLSDPTDHAILGVWSRN